MGWTIRVSKLLAVRKLENSFLFFLAELLIVRKSLILKTISLLSERKAFLLDLGIKLKNWSICLVQRTISNQVRIGNSKQLRLKHTLVKDLFTLIFICFLIWTVFYYRFLTSLLLLVWYCLVHLKSSSRITILSSDRNKSITKWFKTSLIVFLKIRLITKWATFSCWGLKQGVDLFIYLSWGLRLLAFS